RGAVLVEEPQTAPGPFPPVRPQAFRAPAAVVRDDGGGGLQDLRRRAVVALERYDSRGRKILVEAEDVLDLRSPPAVDRLVLVAHGAEGVRAFAEEAHQRILGNVRVLIFVDE